MFALSCGATVDTKSLPDDADPKHTAGSDVHKHKSNTTTKDSRSLDEVIVVLIPGLLPVTVCLV